MSKSKPKKTEKSLRQAINDRSSDKPKKRRLKGSVKQASGSAKNVISKGRKEYYLPLPDTKTGRFLNKKRSLIPKYFKDSWAELKQVTWPDRKTTIKLTIAVLVFAIVFGIAVAIVDYGLDKLFKLIILE